LQPQVFSLQSARLCLKLQHTLCNDNLIFAAECGGTFAVSNCFSPLKLKICFKFCSRKGTNGTIASKTAPSLLLQIFVAAETGVLLSLES